MNYDDDFDNDIDDLDDILFGNEADNMGRQLQEVQTEGEKAVQSGVIEKPNKDRQNTKSGSLNRVSRDILDSIFDSDSDKYKDDYEYFMQKKDPFDDDIDDDDILSPHLKSLHAKDRYRLGQIHWKLGSQKRQDKPIFRSKTKMSQEKFDNIYNETLLYVKPLYDFFNTFQSYGELEVQDYENFKTFLENMNLVVRPENDDTEVIRDYLNYYNNSKEEELASEVPNWNKFHQKIYDDFKRNRGNCQNAKNFQQINNDKYIYPDQILRYHRFRKDDESNRAYLARKQMLKLDKEGARSRRRRKKQMNNIISFIFHNDDDWEMKNWYMNNKREGDYDRLKTMWNTFKADNYEEFNNYFSYNDRGFVIYDDIQIPFKDLELLLSYVSLNNDINKFINKIKEIYKIDLNNYASHISPPPSIPLPLPSIQDVDNILGGDDVNVNINDDDLFFDGGAPQATISFNDEESFEVAAQTAKAIAASKQKEKASKQKEKTSTKKAPQVAVATEKIARSKKANAKNEVAEKNITRRSERIRNRKEEDEAQYTPAHVFFDNDKSRYSMNNMDREDLLGIPMNNPEAIPINSKVRKHDNSGFVAPGTKCMKRSRKVTTLCKKGDQITTAYGYNSRRCPRGSVEYRKECESKPTGDGIFKQMGLTKYSRRPKWRQNVYIDGNKKPSRRSVKKK